MLRQNDECSHKTDFYETGNLQDRPCKGTYIWEVSRQTWSRQSRQIVLSIRHWGKLLTLNPGILEMHAEKYLIVDLQSQQLPVAGGNFWQKLLCQKISCAELSEVRQAWLFNWVAAISCWTEIFLYNNYRNIDVISRYLATAGLLYVYVLFFIFFFILCTGWAKLFSSNILMWFFYRWVWTNVATSWSEFLARLKEFQVVKRKDWPLHQRLDFFGSGFFPLYSRAHHQW